MVAYVHLFFFCMAVHIDLCRLRNTSYLQIHCNDRCKHNIFYSTQIIMFRCCMEHLSGSIIDQIRFIKRTKNRKRLKARHIRKGKELTFQDSGKRTKIMRTRGEQKLEWMQKIIFTNLTNISYWCMTSSISHELMLVRMRSPKTEQSVDLNSYHARIQTKKPKNIETVDFERSSYFFLRERWNRYSIRFFRRNKKNQAKRREANKRNKKNILVVRTQKENKDKHAVSLQRHSSK